MSMLCKHCTKPIVTTESAGVPSLGRQSEWQHEDGTGAGTAQSAVVAQWCETESGYAKVEPLRTKTGRPITTEDIEALVWEAEQGYDVEKLKQAPSRALTDYNDMRLLAQYILIGAAYAGMPSSFWHTDRRIKKACEVLNIEPATAEEYATELVDLYEEESL